MANELTDQEKFEKLLKFAGFKDTGKTQTVWTSTVDKIKTVYKVWLDPDGTTTRINPPNLLNSLGAQEKWLFPLFTYYRLELVSTGKHKMVIDIYPIMNIEGIGSTPEDAVAEACLKLEERETK